MKTTTVLAVAVALASTAVLASETLMAPLPMPTFNGVTPPAFTSPMMERSRGMLEKQKARMEKLNQEMAGLPPEAQQIKMRQAMQENIRDQQEMIAAFHNPQTFMEEQAAREKQMNEMRRVAMEQANRYQANLPNFAAPGKAPFEAMQQATVDQYKALEAQRKAWQQAQVKAYEDMNGRMKTAMEQQMKAWQQMEAARVKAVQEMMEQQQAAFRKAAEISMKAAKPAV